MTRYALIAAAGAVLALSAALWVLIDRNGDLRAAQEVSDARLRACNARVTHILEDQERDNAIDTLDDDGLRDLFLDRWMRNPGPR